jgi:hypothetical protein
MTKQRRTRIWVVPGTLALLLLAAGNAWTQDVFASNGGGSGSSTPVYQDSFSSGCDKTSHLVSGGYNPAYCFQLTLTGSGSKCPAIGGQDSTLAGQAGSACFYCQEAGPMEEKAVPGGHWIVVPNDSSGVAYAAYQQGYVCAANPADNCYLSCFGPGNFKPPPGTTLMPGTGTGGTPTPSAGNPPPVKPPAVLEQQAPSKTKLKGTVTTNVTACSSLFDLLRAPKFTSKEVTDLTIDLGRAKATLVKANRYISQAKWTPATVALAEKYFGNASAETQATLRKNVANVLATLIGIKTATSTIYPTGTEVLAPEVSDNCIAYVHDPEDTQDERDLNKIFLCKKFFALPQSGPDSQPMVLVHEVSHLRGGASTRDYAYGATDCGALVTFTTTGLGKLGAWISQDNLTPKSPKLVDLTDKAPLDNADSFKYFVYDVANQATSK